MGSGPSKEPDTYRLLMVGVTGSGKSSTGNSILGKPLFNSGCRFQSVTQECSMQREKRDNIMIEVMDTPGFSDFGRSEAEISNCISKFLGGVSPGPHAVLVVMSGSSRYTDDVDKAYRQAQKLLGGRDLVSRIILVFTGGDVLKKENVTIESQIDNSAISLKQIVKDVCRRFVLFDNTATGSAQKQQLAKLLAEVRKVCGSDFTYLSNPAQTKINDLIEREALDLAHKKKMLICDANFQIRKELVDATTTDPLLKQAADIIRKEMEELINKLNTRMCTFI